jgi:hypothetical protein
MAGMSKTIPVHQGRHVALVDDDDYTVVSQFSWCLNADGYVVGRVGPAGAFEQKPTVLNLDTPVRIQVLV